MNYKNFFITINKVHKKNKLKIIIPLKFSLNKKQRKTIVTRGKNNEIVKK